MDNVASTTPEPTPQAEPAPPAEPVAAPVAAPTPPVAPSQDDLLAKIAQIVDSTAPAKANKVIDGMKGSQGLTDDEAAELKAAYKDYRKQVAAAPNEELQTLRDENAAFKAAEALRQVQKSAAKIAKELEVDADSLEDALTLARLDSCVVDGVLDEAKAKEALEAVLKRRPEFKNPAANAGFTPVGASGATGGVTGDGLDALLKAAGVPPKQKG